MNGHGVEIANVNLTNGNCSCVDDCTKTTSCIILEIALKSEKIYKFYLFDDETMGKQSITNYLTEKFKAIQGTASTFSVRKGDHPGYIEFKFKGEFKRISGRVAT